MCKKEAVLNVTHPKWLKAVTQNMAHVNQIFIKHLFAHG